MYARSTNINGDPANSEAGISYVRDEVMPMITAMDGCLGLSLLVDRETGRGIATSSWDSLEALNASREALAGARARGGEIIGGTPEIDEWEVAVMHRDHRSADGACCRVAWARPPDLDAVIDYFRGTVLAAADELDGFCSASLFVDRAGGRTCSTMTFDTRASLEATREFAGQMRARATAATGIEFYDVAEFELALAHLHLPELV
jgi:heme-degrading monooxygenase HmoA